MASRGTCAEYARAASRGPGAEKWSVVAQGAFARKCCGALHVRMACIWLEPAVAAIYNLLMVFMHRASNADERAYGRNPFNFQRYCSGVARRRGT